MSTGEPTSSGRAVPRAGAPLDPCRPLRHIRPPRGWINDPNGVGWAAGRWHVFFQYNPASTRHETIRWGHAASLDLVHWDYLPDVLVPEVGTLNAGGSWSGCLALDGEVPTLCYTALAAGGPADAVGAVAIGSPDLVEWTPVAVAAAARMGEALAETRDPFVVMIDGRRCIVQGHGGIGFTAKVVVHDATDLRSWPVLGDLVDVSDPIAAQVAPADIWECPNLLLVDGRWVLIVSLWQHRDGQTPLSGVRWLVGDLEVDADGVPRFVPVRGGVLDEGPAFYAPQAATHEGRTLLFGWSWELDAPERAAERGWAGVITTPRELHVRDDQLLCDLPREWLDADRRPLGAQWRASDEPCVLVQASGASVLSCRGTGVDWSLDVPAGAQVVTDGALVELFDHGITTTTRMYPGSDAVWQIDGQAIVAAVD